MSITRANRRPTTSPSCFRAFIKEFKITYNNGMTESKTTGAYKLTGVPETFFVDRDGEIVKHWVGAISESELRSSIDLIR